MEGDDGEGGAEPAEVRGPRAEASYVSTEAVNTRVAAAVVRDLEDRPGYWRPFVVRHVLMTLLFVGVIVVLTAFGYANLAGLVRGTAFALALMAGLTAFDLWQVRRGLRRRMRAHHHAASPPGTELSAVWTPADVVVREPTHEIRIELRTITGARYSAGVLLLDQEGSAPAWAVPDELLGPEGLAIVRESLGVRLREGF